MKARRALILLSALVLLVSCGGAPKTEDVSAELAEIVLKLESLEQRVADFEDKIGAAVIPKITVDYDYGEQCRVWPWELHLGNSRIVIIDNKTKSVLTFRFKNPVFGAAPIEIGPETQRVIYLAPNGTQFPRTEYEIIGDCFKQPSPGPWVLFP